MGVDTKFRALVVEKTADKQFIRKIRERSLTELPPGDLLIRVHYSSLNYKDALSATGHPGVTRQYPHTPGIDAAGEVVSCEDDTFLPGDRVIVTSYDLGMETDGGYGQYIRVPSSWAVRLPEGLTLRESMMLGTAGFTAALSVLRLERAGIRPDCGNLLVTGATGGVGSIAVAILAGSGYQVVASTGKIRDSAFLIDLGATLVISREDVTASADKPLLAEKWAAVVDVVGGETLTAALKATKYGGSVTSCGLVGSPELNMNVYPFILRGVSLLGVDSVRCPRDIREDLWRRLASCWKPAHLDRMTRECTLEGLEEEIMAILKGGITGRVVVNLLES